MSAARPERGSALTVVGARMLSPTVRQIDLARPDGAVLPSYAPGSHVTVECRDGRRSTNSYSLTGPGRAPTSYSISVRVECGGRGGSRWLPRVPVGTRLRVGTPRGEFAPFPTRGVICSSRAADDRLELDL
ncbi:FAD-binding oxidoreductase [Rhodococcus rhodnii]|uniref:Phthalate 4,5-dioxygenase n=1 Tax=Rhodococcus rhodnii LMG 5362 TaxID=1273125 RepID=R7WJ29_9NOCA|nr:FAD-binding oxidoreductase [Rhodococcus rhodnii]EOM75260.1 phthalate 4,5-dioxygenase [Rhodococcus rhodnii LMG 5362]